MNPLTYKQLCRLRYMTHQFILVSGNESDLVIYDKIQDMIRNHKDFK